MLLFTLRKVQNGKLNISSVLRATVSSIFINVLAQTESWHWPWQQWPVCHTVHSGTGYCPQTTLPPQTCSTKLPPGWTCHKHTPSGPGSPPIEDTKQTEINRLFNHLSTEINSAWTPLSLSVVLNLTEPHTEKCISISIWWTSWMVQSQRDRGTLQTFTHLSLADIATFLTDDVVDNSPVVQSVDQSTTGGVHKRVLQGTEQNPVQLLYIMLICSLEENMKKKKIVKDRHSVPVTQTLRE